MPLLEDAVSVAASALGIPAVFVAPLVDLLETIARAPNAGIAIEKARINAAADAAELAAEATADAIIKAGRT